MGNGAGSTDLTNFFSNDDFWSTLLLTSFALSDQDRLTHHPNLITLFWCKHSFMLLWKSSLFRLLILLLHVLSTIDKLHKCLLCLYDIYYSHTSADITQVASQLSW